MIDLRLLGPFEASLDGRPVALPAGKPTALLARLLLDAGRVVPVDTLLESIWPEPVPPSARKVLQVYVSQLRKALGAERIETRARGYVLRAARDEHDLGRFESLADRAGPFSSTSSGSGRGRSSRSSSARFSGRTRCWATGARRPRPPAVRSSAPCPGCTRWWLRFAGPAGSCCSSTSSRMRRSSPRGPPRSSGPALPSWPTAPRLARPASPRGPGRAPRREPASRRRVDRAPAVRGNGGGAGDRRPRCGGRSRGERICDRRVVSGRRAGHDPGRPRRAGYGAAALRAGRPAPER